MHLVVSVHLSFLFKYQIYQQTVHIAFQMISYALIIQMVKDNLELHVVVLIKVMVSSSFYSKQVFSFSVLARLFQRKSQAVVIVRLSLFGKKLLCSSLLKKY